MPSCPAPVAEAEGLEGGRLSSTVGLRQAFLPFSFSAFEFMFLVQLPLPQSDFRQIKSSGLSWFSVRFLYFTFIKASQVQMLYIKNINPPLTPHPSPHTGLYTLLSEAHNLG